jgi:hypothetical protein
MVGCFINIRGVEHPNKQRFMREKIREEEVCFIGLCETIKSNFTPSWFKKILENRNFVWESIPPVGRSSGLFLGVDTDFHDVVETKTGKHFIRMQLFDNTSSLCWHLVVIYGPAQVEDKEDFLAKFAQLCNKCK